MKTWPVLAIVTLIGMSAIPIARGDLESERPPGVAPQAWVPMGDGAGFVVTGNSLSNGMHVQRDRTVMIPRPALHGYFVARRGKTWYRIDTAPEPGLAPAGQ